MSLSEANITQVRNEARALIQEERTAAAVSVKLPPFWPEKARFWFTIVEANFVTGRITDEKIKYYHVVRQLDSNTAGCLWISSKILRIQTLLKHLRSGF